MVEFVRFMQKRIYRTLACVMSAPGALAISKILYPELQKSRFRGVNAKQPDKLDASNVVEAASMGASQAIPLG